MYIMACTVYNELPFCVCRITVSSTALAEKFYCSGEVCYLCIYM